MAEKNDGIKRPLPAFVYFSQEKRKEIHIPGMAVPELSKILGQMWKEMKDEEKAPYEELSDKDKQRYFDELQLIGRKPHRQRGNSSSSRKSTPSSKDTSESSDKPPRKRRKKASTPVSSTRHIAYDSRAAVALQNAFVPGLQIPVFTEAFLLHNKKLNSELMKLRQIKKDLLDQKLRLDETIQSIDKDTQRFSEMIQQQLLLNEKLDKNLHLIRKVVSDFLCELELPNIGSSSNVEEMLDKIPKGGISLSEDSVKNFIDKLHDLLPDLENSGQN